MFCPKCGKEINNDSNFCYNCGEKIEMQQFTNTYKQNNEENKEQQFGNYQDPSNNSNKQGYYYAPVQNTSNNRSNDLFSKLKKSFAQHKKTYIIVISILVAIFIISRIISGVSSDNNYYQNSELNSTSKSVQVPVYHTTIKVISSENLMFSIYDINIIIDDEKIGTINNGQSETYELELEEGEHTLVINSAEDKSVKGEIDFNIKGEDKLQFKAYSYSSSIDIKEQNFEQETTEGTTEETASEKATIEETTTKISTSETTTKEETVLNVNNCPDLKKVLSVKDPTDPIIEKFADEHYGEIIQFDGCVMLVENHVTNKGKVYKTRYDVMFGAGDFDENSQRGPNFKYDDVNRYDMGLTTDGIYVGQNVRVKARVGEYNSNTTIFLLEPISLDER